MTVEMLNQIAVKLEVLVDALSYYASSNRVAIILNPKAKTRFVRRIEKRIPTTFKELNIPYTDIVVDEFVFCKVVNIQLDGEGTGADILGAHAKLIVDTIDKEQKEHSDVHATGL